MFNSWGSSGDYTITGTVDAINWITSNSGMTMNDREYHYDGITGQPNYRTDLQATWCPAVAAGTGAKFTRGGAWLLIYAERHRTRNGAMKREVKLKRDRAFRALLRAR